MSPLEKNGKLFIVADTTDKCEVLQRQLDQSGWDIRQFTDPEDAVAQVKEVCPSVVLVDLPLPLIQQKYAHQPMLDADTAYVVITPDISAREVANLFHRHVADVLIRPFDRERLCQAVKRASSQKSLVLENRRYRMELERANRELQENLKILKMDQLAGRQVQQSLLPVTPYQYGDYEIAHHIVPSLILSGDFVAYSVVMDRFLVFYAADVSGHGASSAFVTVLLKFLLNRVLRRHITLDNVSAMVSAPEGFAEHINKQLLQLDLDKHLTMFAGTVDMDTSTLRYTVSAHMPSPVIVTEDADGHRVARRLTEQGKPIGIYEDVRWDVHQLTLPDKFALGLVSDGVMEFIPGDNHAEKEQYIEDRFMASDQSVDGFCASLSMDAVDAVPDDVTILTLRKGY